MKETRYRCDSCYKLICDEEVGNSKVITVNIFLGENVSANNKDLCAKCAAKLLTKIREVLPYIDIK